MRRRRLLGLTAAALGAAAFGSGCAGGDERSLRIGVLRDCVGAFRNLGDAALSGAELPFLARGAELRGTGPGAGVSAAEVAGRSVELVPGCTEGGEFTTVIADARRLVEHEHVDAVVAGTWPGDGATLREVARLYPDVAFVPALSGPREVTLRNPAPNLYRVAPDFAQAVSGLAEYAYRDLGWRRTAIVAEDWESGWASAAAFAAEFCALGGTVATQVTVPLSQPAGVNLAERIPTTLDGVAVLVSPISRPAPLLKRLARRVGDPARRIVAGPYVMLDPALRGSLRPELAGVVGVSLTGAADGRGVRAQRRAYGRAFPGLPADFALNEWTVGYRDAVEAVVQALERADGDLSDGRRRLREELARLRTEAVRGTVTIGPNGQALASGLLVRLRGDATLAHVRTARPVDQSLGGLLAPALSPDATPQTCGS
jgi:branched-chain amino acid transport system substrate-binding protein